MSRLIDLNGMPMNGQSPPVLAPGQSRIALGAAETPAGVALVVQVDGHQLVVPFPPGQAAQFGLSLIGAEAVWTAKHSGNNSGPAASPG